MQKARKSLLKNAFGNNPTMPPPYLGVAEAAGLSYASLMLGPHQGKELELMLSGEKHLAAFGDAVPEDGIISEEIIPERTFAPFVEKGLIHRFAREQFYPDQILVRTVCFTTPNNEWRAHAYFWAIEEGIAKRRPFDDAHEYLIGRLLGYSEEDIAHFIQNLKTPRRKLAV